ncbi:MAG: FAD-dependent oxidoreductase, partial [Chloroflexota bacterium]|nr:FAD-dependent oxidoreductase [Chloroflexota bacterium]
MESRPLVVVGAGAAGTAAAIEAAEAGVPVTLVDENPIPATLAGLNVPQFFGQRFARDLQDQPRMLERMTAVNEALAKARVAGVDVQLGTCVWGAFRNSDTSRVLDGPQLGLADRDRSWMIKYDRLIVATGARDLGLAFGGWNQAGAMGANGAHSLLHHFQALASRRMVVLGSGNLGLNTARLALKAGIDVAAVVEVSSSVRGDATLSAALQGKGVEVCTSHALKQAVGRDGEIESVVLIEIDGSCEPVAGTERVFAADTVCLAIGLTPNVELLSLLRCDLAFDPGLGGYVPVHDDRMRTSVDDVFVAGDVAGFHDAMALDSEIARNQGRLAGVAAAESLGAIDGAEAAARRRDLQASISDLKRNDAYSHWTRWLQALLNAGGSDVRLCPCEDVTRSDVIGLRPPRFLEWDPEQNRRRSLE